ncbi:PolC-type DNA polymerase III, partial [Lachnotalea glycerini]
MHRKLLLLTPFFSAGKSVVYKRQVLQVFIESVKDQCLDETHVVFDLETTGFSPIKNKIIEIGAVKIIAGEIVDRFSAFVNPTVPIPFEIEKLTGINDNMVINEPKIEEILPKFMEFCNGSVMVAHNAGFDMGFIKANCAKLGLECDYTVIDTVAMARLLLPSLNRYKLDSVAKTLGVSLENHHRAIDDAGCTAEIYIKFIEMLKERDIYDLSAVNKTGGMTVDAIKKLPTYHAIILAKNDVGRINLYKLISYSHINYYSRRPRIPKSEYLKHREGLIIGSACEAGELYKAVLNGEPEEEISRLVNFYDYLEIQPLGNNQFMLRDEKYSQITSNQDLIAINKKIVQLGEQFKKPVVATCD